MILSAIKTIALVNATIAMGFAVFYELLKLCLTLHVSPWFAAVALVGAYMRWLWWLWKRCREAEV
jgi:hypothetical protein